MQQIKDEVHRLKWAKSYRIRYIIHRYGKISRQAMDDEQLTHFLGVLKSLPTPSLRLVISRSRKRRERGRYSQKVLNKSV
ncbi:MAG: hypothetical protein AAFQ80_05440 [Cyanobacteria bacterium J06621_8]